MLVSNPSDLHELKIDDNGIWISWSVCLEGISKTLDISLFWCAGNRWLISKVDNLFCPLWTSAKSLLYADRVFFKISTCLISSMRPFLDEKLAFLTSEAVSLICKSVPLSKLYLIYGFLTDPTLSSVMNADGCIVTNT